MWLISVFKRLQQVFREACATQVSSDKQTYLRGPNQEQFYRKSSKDWSSTPNFGLWSYPLRKFWLNHLILLQPYQKEAWFNGVFFSSRVSVERAFILLKARWRCLLTTLDANIENVSEILICRFILHNFCQLNADH